MSANFPTNNGTRNPKRRPLSEKEMTEVLIWHLKKLGYLTTTELVLDDTLFNIRQLTGKPISKVRIDIAAYKDNKVTFIEVENGLWVTHPAQYCNFADRVLLACPAEKITPTDDEQIALAKAKGIGIVRVSAAWSIIPVLPPVDREVLPSVKKAVISLLRKRISKHR